MKPNKDPEQKFFKEQFIKYITKRDLFKIRHEPEQFVEVTELGKTYRSTFKEHLGKIYILKYEEVT